MVGLITKEESIQEGIQILRRMTFQDSYGKNYIFMTNYEGTMLVIPYQMEKRGLNQWNLQDINGKYLIHEIIKLAKRGKVLLTTTISHLAEMYNKIKFRTLLGFLNGMHISEPVCTQRIWSAITKKA